MEEVTVESEKRFRLPWTDVELVPDVGLVLLVALSVGVAWVLYAENRKLREALQSVAPSHPCNCQETEGSVNGKRDSDTSESELSADSGTVSE